MAENGRDFTSVYAVHSLKEAAGILRRKERLTPRRVVKAITVTCWVAVANLLLDSLRRVLFSRIASPRGIKGIVVYTVGILGDNAVLLPALAALRRGYPGAQITVVTNCQTWSSSIAEEILGPSPLKDRLILLGEDPVRRSGGRFLIAREKFAGVGCDLFVNLSPFGNRGWFGAVARELVFARALGARHAVGFRMSTLSRGRLFDEVQYRFVENEPRRYRQVLAQLGLPSENGDFLGRDPEAAASIVAKLADRGADPASVFVVNPGAKFAAKCWPAERFGKVAGFLATCGGQVIVTGTFAERELAEEVVRHSGGAAINLAGETTVTEMVELLRLARGCVTNDTGTMHLAAMVGVPSVAIFSGRHSPTHWLPAGEKVVSLFSLPGCRYCYDDYCQTGECLKAISTDMVIAEFRKMFGVHEDQDTVEKGRPVPARPPATVFIAIPLLLLGGTEIQTLSVVRVLVGAGYRVAVCCYYESDAAVVAQFEAAGAEVILMGLSRSRQRSGLGNLVTLVRELVLLLRERRPDIVHVQYLAPGLVPIVAARLAGIRNLFATVHIAGDFAYGRKAKLLLRTAARLCTSFFCVSRGVEEFWFGDSMLLEPDVIERGRRHFTIYNAVDVGRIGCVVETADSGTVRRELGIAPGAPVVGIVGRLAEQKGHAYLLEAFAEARQHFPAAVLVVIGDGPMRRALEEKASGLGIDGAVRWLGSRSQEEVFRLYAAMDVFAMPSLFEGFGLTAAEAMAAGLPVIGTRVEGLSEVVTDGETGVLVPPGDHGALAEAIVELLRHPQQARAMGEHGRARAGRLFSMERFSAAVNAAYQSLPSNR